MRRQARFLRLQAPVIGMAQKFGDAARMLPVVAAMLALRGRGHFGDGDVMDVAQLTLRGLVQQAANVA